MKILDRLKRGQEELIGFAIIMVVVFVILLVFLGLSMRDRGHDPIESYEVEAFIDAMLAYTTDCEDYLDTYESLDDLLFKHFNNEQCVNGPPGPILDSTLMDLLNKSWNVGPNASIKGYDMVIRGGGAAAITMTFGEGNQTSNSRGSLKSLYSSRGSPINITFIAYY